MKTIGCILLKFKNKFMLTTFATQQDLYACGPAHVVLRANHLSTWRTTGHVVLRANHLSTWQTTGHVVLCSPITYQHGGQQVTWSCVRPSPINMADNRSRGPECQSPINMADNRSLGPACVHHLSTWRIDCIQLVYSCEIIIAQYAWPTTTIYIGAAAGQNPL